MLRRLKRIIRKAIPKKQKPMKIVMTLLVRDEEDILRANIEFHRAMGVDFFIATDNKSVDSTAEILKDYERQGLLHYIYEGTDDYNQTEWVTKMARLAESDFDATWVINNDAD
ncbi:MAG: glycosyltransferase family 2 protein, partial [Gammaproteobacteria bacterium]|nr:glycosyltransferase family 2 protein [Gammaproteobacteria bacterium]